MCDPTQVYYQHLREGELWLQYCPDCRRYIFFPRSHCPICWGQRWEWRRSRGKGQVYSYSVIRVSTRADEQVPYIYALITLDEGVRMASRVVDCDLQSAAVDMRVEMVPASLDGQIMPLFRPISAQGLE